MMNQGDGSFGPPTLVTGFDIAAGTGFGARDTVAAADLDGDGDIDLAATVLGGTIQEDGSIDRVSNVVFLINDGRGAFPEADQITIESSLASDFFTSRSGLLPADLDGDGDIDLVAVSLTSDEVFLLFNEFVGAGEGAGDGDGTP
jgi:hypothetical protein